MEQKKSNICSIYEVPTNIRPPNEKYLLLNNYVYKAYLHSERGANEFF